MINNFCGRIRLLKTNISFIFLLFVCAPSALCTEGGGGGGVFEGNFDPTLGITIVLHKNSSTGSIISSMDFGVLVPFTNPNTGGITLRSSTSGSTGTGSVVAMIYPQPTGKPYYINCYSNALTEVSGKTIPSGACVVVPVYSAFDNDFGDGPQPLVGTLGEKGSWVGASPGRQIYQSNSIGDYRAIQTHFSITDDPATGASSYVPIDQMRGTYNATVTFTITE